jgi:hypothetical protein
MTPISYVSPQSPCIFDPIYQFLVKMKLFTEEEFDPLYQLALAEMQSNNFCAVTLFLSVWGKSPNNAR